MIMIFEDKITSGISKLLTHAYSNDECGFKRLHFTDGNLNIEGMLNELKEYVNIIVYVDIMPDKAATIDVYKTCVEWVRKNNRKDVFILPIPCIEFYVIKSFFDKSLDEVDVVLKFGDYRNVRFNSKGRQLSVTDFESYCKSVVDNYRGCFRTKGDFYVKDCLCKNVDYLKDCTQISLIDKAWILVTSLPMFIGSNSNKVKKTEKINMRDVESKCKSKYYDIANKYVELGIIDFVIELD